MSSDERRVVVVSEGRGRAFEAGALPLCIGTRAGDEIRVPGAHDEALASFGMLGDQPFVLSARPSQTLELNGAPLVGSKQLADGDRITAADGLVVCRIYPHEVRLEVSHAAAAQAASGASEAAGAGADDEVLKPTPFTPSSHAARAAGPGGPGRGRRAGLLVVGLCLLGVVLLGVLGFVLTAVPVGFAIEPKPDELALPATWASFHLEDRYLLRPGRHVIVAEKQGYHRLEEEVEVTRAAGQVFRFRMRRLPGLLEVVASEPGAQVWIDGSERGQTPLVDLEVEEGAHTLRVKARRHLPDEREIQVEGGGVRQRFEVALTPAWAPVTLSSKPPGARVLVDGEELGTTPGTFGLDAGRRELVLELPGHDPFRTEVLVQASEPQTLDEVVLDPADGVLRITSDPPGAQVVVGQSSSPGRTPIEVPLDPGRDHRVSLFKPGYAMARRTVRLEPGESRSLRVALEAQLGRVHLKHEPADAEVRVDGRPVEVGERGLELVAVPHRIEVRKEGFEPQVLDVTPRPDFPLRLDVRLEKRGVAPKRSPLETSLGQKLVRVPPGEFEMGSPRSDPQRRRNEARYRVRLTRGFLIGVNEVTNAEYRQFRPDYAPAPYAGHAMDGDRQPATRISWDDAARFCNWLSEREGLPPAYRDVGGEMQPIVPVGTGYRLPTEAEWAWAARHAGGKAHSVYPWGDVPDPPANSGNYADASAAGVVPHAIMNYNDGSPVTAPVGQNGANALGLNDVGGNVAEWVNDRYGIPPERGGDQPTIDPLGARMGAHRVIRGAGFKDAGTTRLRLAYRDYGRDGREDVGFRIARFER